MSEKIETKESDREEVEKAAQMLINYMVDHPEIEPAIWSGALFSCIVNGFFNAGFTYERFSSQLDNLKKFYKKLLEYHRK